MVIVWWHCVSDWWCILHEHWIWRDHAWIVLVDRVKLRLGGHDVATVNYLFTGMADTRRIILK